MALHADLVATWLLFPSCLPPFDPHHGSVALGVGMPAPGAALLVFSIMAPMPNPRVAFRVLLGFLRLNYCR